jgi:hypothetical protein
MMPTLAIVGSSFELITEQMMRDKPDLIVPIRDRRQHRRILTLRNAAISFAVLVVLFIGITVRSEMEPRHRDAFGRLLERELPPTVESKPVEVVTEAAPIDDHTASDPMLVAPAAREQWLHDSSNTASVAGSIEPVAAPAITLSRRSGARDTSVAIVGGPEGVSVVEQKRKQPLLTGGFGRTN